MKLPLCVFLLLSLALHTVLFLWQIKLNRLTPPPLRWVELSQEKGSSAKTDARGTKSTRRSQRLSLKDLGIDWKSSPTDLSLPRGVGKFTGKEGDAGLQSDEVEKYGQIAIVRKTVLYHSLYHQIDDALSYPAEFKDSAIEGDVKVELIFNEAGLLQLAASRFRSSSPYLRVYIKRLLALVFSDPIPKTYLRGKGLRLLCDFHFELVSRENSAWLAPVDRWVTHVDRPLFTGRSLVFSRSGKRAGSWRLGPFAGNGIAPVIAIDPSWFYEQGKDLLSHNAPADPLVKYRHDPFWRE